MNKKQCRRCVVLFATILCLTAVANAQRADKKGKK
jgi:hypothetical protein